MSDVQFLAALSKLSSGITAGQVVDIAALVVEWAKARQEYHRLSHEGRLKARFEAYLAWLDLTRRLAAAVGLPSPWVDGPAPDAPGAAHEP